MPWHIEQNAGGCGGDTPYAVIKDSDGSTAGCHPTQEDAQVQVDALYANDPNASGGDAESDLVTMETNNVVPWSGVLAVEGVPTGDGRQFAAGALTWATLPLPLRWLKESTHGGMQVNGVVNIGRIDAVERVASQIIGRGVIDIGQPDGVEAARQMGTTAAPGFLSGISIDADDPMRAEVEYIWADGCADLDVAAASEEDFMRCMEPEMVIYHSGRIRAATLCDIPAFDEARVYLAEALPDPAKPPVSGAPVPVPDDAKGAPPVPPKAATSSVSVADVVEVLTAAAHTITIEDLPPADWFYEPRDMPDVGAITVTDDGRIFGLLAPRNVAHRAFADRLVTVPHRHVDYSTWMCRETIVAGGGRIAAGAITMDCGHAPVGRGGHAQPAVDHYDNACSVVASACVGENQHGVWIAGSLMPGVSPSQVARMLACQLSGDWRPHRSKPGTRELCGVLLVPVPGFPVANRRMSVRTDGGQLVASSVPMVYGEYEPNGNSAILTAAAILAREVGRDRRTRAAELAGKVRK